MVVLHVETNHEINYLFKFFIKKKKVSGQHSEVLRFEVCKFGDEDGEGVC